MVEGYVIGTKPVPEWCRRLITPYKRLNGGTGYESTEKEPTLVFKRVMSLNGTDMKST